MNANSVNIDPNIDVEQISKMKQLNASWKLLWPNKVPKVRIWGAILTPLSFDIDAIIDVKIDGEFLSLQKSKKTKVDVEKWNSSNRSNPTLGDPHAGPRPKAGARLLHTLWTRTETPGRGWGE